MSFQALIGEKSKLTFLAIEWRAIVYHFRVNLWKETILVFFLVDLIFTWCVFVKWILKLTFTLCIHCIWFRSWSKSLMYPSQISQMTNDALPPADDWPGFIPVVADGFANCAAAACSEKFDGFVAGCRGSGVIDMLGCCCCLDDLLPGCCNE